MKTKPTPPQAGVPTAAEYLSAERGAASKDWMHGWDECRAYVAKQASAGAHPDLRSIREAFDDEIQG